ncbi:tetratricopeptide repeat protein [Pseudomonas sp. FP1740]|uniref:tetratricopeptide repeat protein n=1 Tax=Pseudomonas sp. FP1740 TaxID=2954078 RepID=UPI002736F7A9|nr:hypothetical protein [Pseudomonas sp. FP1740]WLG46421.1 hypothetical protein PSH69_07340 [Pseudomonas sp. FP1740]
MIPPDDGKLDIEVQKMGIERERLVLEHKRVSQADRSLVLEDRKVSIADRNLVLEWGKLFIALVVACIGAFAFTLKPSSSNSAQATNPLELQQRGEELLIKRSELQMSKEATKAKFLQDNLELISSTAPESEAKVTALVKALWPPVEASDILHRAKLIRDSIPKPTVETASPTPTVAPDYVALGKAYVSKGDFEQARASFELASIKTPVDPMVWNYKAYAEMRVGRTETALQSIKTAIGLRPTQHSDQLTVVINVSKILCSATRVSEGVDYFNRAIHQAPDLLEKLRIDEELKKRCVPLAQQREGSL